MDKQQRAKELLGRLKELKKQLPSKATNIVDDLVSEVSSSLFKQVADGPIPKKIEELSRQFADFKDVDVATLTKSLQDADEKNTTSFTEYSSGMEARLTELVSRLENADKSTDEKSTIAVQNLLTDLDEFRGEFSQEKVASANRASLLEAELSRVMQLFEKAKEEFATKETLETAVTTSITVSNQATEELKKLISDLETSTGSRIASILNTRGGNMDRNIAIGGNTSVLSRYTDINLKAGANTTITYAYNDSTKYTDVTISASGGGGGSVTGIIRSVNNIATNTNAGAVAGTDYVYLAGATLNLTLPTSVGNSNLYTVKNTGSGTVTVLPTGAETIDGSSNLILPLQFTSVDLISNNSGNWDIT